MQKYDVSVVGKSLQAGIISGLIARDHNKRVCLFIEQSVQHQITRKIDFSFECATRPHTWEMRSAALAESVLLIKRIGGGRALGSTNPLVVCTKPKTANALAHMYHYLRGVDYEIERLSVADTPQLQAAYRARGVRVVRPSVLWPKLFEWLNSLGVDVFEPTGLQISKHRDGSSHLKTNTQNLDAARLLLADEYAISQYASPHEINRLFFRCPTSSVLCEPVSGLSNQLTLNPENHFSARIRSNGTVEILAITQMDQMANLVKSNISGDLKFRRIGRSVFTSLVSRDGAPIVGKLGRSGIWGFAGFGHASLFLAPAMARFVCDSANETEREFFDLHRADGKRNSEKITDICCSQNRTH